MEFDLAVGAIADALKDYIVARGLSDLGERLGCGPGLVPERPEAARAALMRLRVPPSRAHAHHHLMRAAEALWSLPPDPLPGLRDAWRNLATATRESGHSLIDLSQCCGGHLSKTRRTSDAL